MDIRPVVGTALALTLVSACDRVFDFDAPHTVADADPPADPPADAVEPDSGPMPDASDPHLVARFDFEGTFVETQSGHAATCLNTNGCPTFVPGMHGMGIQLDGSNDCIQFNLPSRPANLTIAFWIKKPSDSGASIVAKPFGPGGSNTFQVDVETGRTLRFITYNGSMDQPLINANVLPLNTWTHVAVTFDGTKKLYVNGTLAPITISADALATDGQPLLIGCDRDAGSLTRYLAAMLDEVVLYDIALAPADIVALAQP